MNFKTIDMYEVITRAQLYTLDMWCKEDDKADAREKMGIEPSIARERADKLWEQQAELDAWLVAYEKEHKEVRV